MSYQYKTKPFDHQRKEFEEHGIDPSRGLFWEQGTGKTKPVIDSTAMLYDADEIDGLCVIAPNGVHRNWVSDELPAHLPDAIAERTRAHIWYSTDALYHKESFNETLKHDGLAVFVISYPAIWTDRGRDAWKAFLKKRRCMYVLDESQRVKNPNAKWSRRIMGSSTVGADYRRCLSGTPCSNSPFDVYNQLRFLDPDIWKRLGLLDFSMFKQYFGFWQTFVRKDERTFTQCVAYKNLNTLHQLLHQLGSRVTKDEVFDLPPKLYSKRYFDVSPKQAEIYQKLKDELMVELKNGTLSAPLAINRLLRFQQIACGYLPASDDDPTLQPIDKINRRLQCTIETCEDLSHQALIWARFTQDIDLLRNHAFMREKDRCVFVDGRITGPKRGEELDKFKRGDVQFLIANVQTDGVRSGQTLLGKTVIYHSNDFSLEHRQQSEDRAHRWGADTEESVNYIDIVAHGIPIDMRIIGSLREKLDVASMVTGDNIKDWI